MSWFWEQGWLMVSWFDGGGWFDVVVLMGLGSGAMGRAVSEQCTVQPPTLSLTNPFSPNQLSTEQGSGLGCGNR